MQSFNSRSASPRLKRKRRIVSLDHRKRALFSCDRCKIRKIKCRRIQNNDLKYDNITPCIECTKAGVACTTSIPRKKRFFGPVKNVNLHYRCLLALVIGLFPDKDVYKIDELIDLGHSLKIEMPSIDSSNDSNSSFRHDTKHKSDKIKVEELKVSDTESEDNKSSDKDSSKKSYTLSDDTAPALRNKPPRLPPSIKIRTRAKCDSDRLIMDKFGHTHYIGNFGTASVLNGLCDIIIKRSGSHHPPTSTQDIRDSTLQTITSENEPVYQYPTHLYNLDAINVDRFPLINLIGREEADIYVEVFFEKVHPYYFIFNRKKFNERYEIFWQEIKKTSTSAKDEPFRLSNAAICCIYMIWILGRRFQRYSNPTQMANTATLSSDMTDRFIDIIRLTLSDVVLTPTIDGIRLLFLFSTYLSSIKVRESGYCLMEMAAIQAKGLGLHRKIIVDKFNDAKSDEMKRIMWSLAKNESILCCSLGRASAIPWEEIDIELPKIEDETDPLFKTYYFQSVRLTRIIFEILDYKKKTQKDPLALGSLEKALTCQKDLQKFWHDLPDEWKDYKSLPIRRFKPKLHIQYHYYFITLTLPMFLHIVSVPNYNIKKGDPLLTLLVHGIQSSFQTAELVTYTDANGFFNGTIYYDVFYCYNAIMVLTLTYILIVSSKQSNKQTSVIDLDYLDSEYGINLQHLLKEINMIRKLILNNLHKIDGTMRRMSDIIETLLDDLGIIQILVKDYNAPKSNAKRIAGKGESGQTSVSASLPGSFRRLKFHLRHERHKRRKRGEGKKKNKTTKNTQQKPTNRYIPMANQQQANRFMGYGRNTQPLFQQQQPQQSLQQGRSQQGPLITAPANDQAIATPLPSSWYDLSINEVNGMNNQQGIPESSFITGPSVMTKEPTNDQSLSSSNPSSKEASVAPEMASDSTPASPTGANINDALTSMALNTDLMNALFGPEVLNTGSRIQR